MFNLTQSETKNRKRKRRQPLKLAGGLLLTLLLAACSSAAPTATSAPAPTATSVPASTSTSTPAPADTATPETMTTPSVTVADQEIVEGTVTVAEVVSDGPGWLVVHADAEGSPGPVLGQTAVQDGANTDVVVDLDLVGVTGVLHAMLHTDAGVVGTYEFPGDDVPVTQGDAIVMVPLSLQAAAGDVEIVMANFMFSPAQQVVQTGTTVTWTNNEEVEHSTTSDTDVWDSGLFGGGESFSFTFDQPGVYPYHCQPHGGPGGQGMSGTIVVVSPVE